MMHEQAGIPAFTRGTRLRHDTVRGQWVLLAPEKAFVPDEIALEILKLVDGITSFGVIIDILAARSGAPRDRVASDVLELARDLAGRRLLCA